jgi:hypothetical protein
VMIAELHQPPVSLTTQLRFEATWLVVNTRVNNPTVPSGLMPSPAILLLKNGDTDTRFPFQNRPGRRQPDDSSANNDAIKFVHADFSGRLKQQKAQESFPEGVKGYSMASP